MKPIDIMWVCLGGGIGSLLRWQIGQYIDSRLSSAFKYSTLFINITGAFVIAYLSAALAIGWHQLQVVHRAALAVRVEQGALLQPPRRG